jgi:hypothetical protein
VNPEPIRNGSDAAGTWHVAFNSDYGRDQGTLELHRDGTTLTGTWSGDFGSNLPVSGTWRDGYVELTFIANWQKEYGKPATEPVPAALAGWIDGDHATGRMKVEGRADGPWTAERKP